MRKQFVTFLILVTLILSTTIVAQTDIFTRKAVISVPEKENGGFGQIITGVDLDEDGKKEIYAINNNWGDGLDTHEMIPTIYKYEFNGSTWDSVWSAELGIAAQNTWPALHWGDWDKDGKKEIIWAPINNFSNGETNPSRVVVFEAVGGASDAMGIASGDNFLPNAEWTILHEDSLKQNMRPFRTAFTDVDGDGTTEFIFTDRAPYFGIGIVSVDDIPDNGGGTENWTLELSGLDSLNVLGVDTTAVLSDMTSYMDMAIVGQTIYIFNKKDKIMGVHYNGTEWQYLPVQTGLPGFQWRTTQVIDIDGDGTQEIITASAWQDGLIRVLKEDGDTLAIYEVGDLGAVGVPNAMGSATGDIDADGKMDIIFGSRDSNPKGAVARVEYNGGDVTAEGSYDISVIDNGIVDPLRQIDFVRVANMDDDAELEIIYSGIPRNSAAPPIVILDYSQVAETVTSIADVKIDADSNYAPDNDGSSFSIIGVVSSINFTATSNRFSYNIQDATAGINITKGSVDGGGTVYEVGDRLLVTGTVAQFRGTTQLNLNDLATDITLLDAGRVLAPVKLSIADYLAAPESFESRLITITGIAPTSDSDAWPAGGSANLTMWNGSPDRVTLRVDSDTDLDENVAPTFPADITGIATQYSFDDPANNGYQITPNSYTDFAQDVAVAPSPYFNMLTPADASTIEIDDSTAEYTVSWNAATDLNGGTLAYQWKLLPDVGTFNATDTSVTVTGAELIAAMGGADTVTVRHTVIALDATGLKATSNDTLSVTLINNVVVGIGSEIVPTQFYVDQNYPNPFNPTTKIKFGLPAQSVVDLRIYDILGREVRTLVNNEDLKAGTYSYNFDASALASGTYIYRLTTGNNVVSKKMLLLK